MLSEKLFEDALSQYPELIEKDLKLFGRQMTYFGKRVDLIFIDRFGEKLIVEIKICNLKREALSQVLEYEGYILSEKDPTARVMIVANRMPLNLKKAMDHHGIEYKEITVKYLKDFLEKKDKTLFEKISFQNPDNQIISIKNKKSVEELILVAEDTQAIKAQEPPNSRIPKTIVRIAYEVLSEEDYKYSEAEYHYEVHVKRREKEDLKIHNYNIKRSPLLQKYGWGIHRNTEGKLALVAMESERYSELKKTIKNTKSFRRKK